MSGSRHKKGSDQERNGAPASNDPVLAGLRDAQERYREMHLAPEQASAAASMTWRGRGNVLNGVPRISLPSAASWSRSAPAPSANVIPPRCPRHH